MAVMMMMTILRKVMNEGDLIDFDRYVYRKIFVLLYEFMVGMELLRAILDSLLLEHAWCACASAPPPSFSD